MAMGEPVAILVPGELPGRMADGAMDEPPLRQPGIDVVLVRVDHRPREDRPLDQRADRRLLDICQHPNHHLAGALDHPEDRRLLLLESPPPRRPLQASASASASARPPFFLTASGFPLCPATTSTSSHSTSPLSFTSGFRWAMPSRS